MTRSQLEEERDFLLTSLRDLDEERAAGDIDEADFIALRDQYTVRAARVLRQLDSAPSPRPEARPRTSRIRSLFLVAAVVAVATLAGVLVSISAGDRLPGDQVSGSLTEGVTAKLARAQDLTAAGKASEAIKVYDEVLREDPKQPQALAYRGWIIHLAGLSDEGLVYVTRAIEADPAYPDAHFFKGMILWRAKGDAASAVVEFQAFLDNNPPPQMVELVKSNLERAKVEAVGSNPSGANASEP